MRTRLGVLVLVASLWATAIPLASAGGHFQTVQGNWVYPTVTTREADQPLRIRLPIAECYNDDAVYDVYRLTNKGNWKSTGVFVNRKGVAVKKFRRGLPAGSTVTLLVVGYCGTEMGGASLISVYVEDYSVLTAQARGATKIEIAGDWVEVDPSAAQEPISIFGHTWSPSPVIDDANGPKIFRYLGLDRGFRDVNARVTESASEGEWTEFKATKRYSHLPGGLYLFILTNWENGELRPWDFSKVFVDVGGA